MHRSTLIKTLVPAFALTTLLGLLPACSGDETRSSTSTATANPITADTLDPADPLAYVTFSLPTTPQCVALGHRFALSLDAEPSAGERWRVIAPPAGPASASIVVLGGTEFVGVPEGNGEQQRLTFAAASLGTVDITVQYVGSDQSVVPGVAEETWNITVTEDGSCPPPPVTDTTVVFGT